MKRKIVFLGFLALVSIESVQSAQFARNAAQKVGKFLWAPSIGLGTLVTGIHFKNINDSTSEFLNKTPNTDELDSAFVQEVQDEAAKRGLSNVDINFIPVDCGVPNMMACGNPEKSKINVFLGWGVSCSEKRLLVTIKEAISATENLLKNSSPGFLDCTERQKYEQTLMQLQNDVNVVPSSDQCSFVIGHELSHVQANDIRSIVCARSVQTMSPFVAWRAARLGGKSRLISGGIADLVFLANIFAMNLFAKNQEYKADYHASQDPRILEAGAELMDNYVMSSDQLNARLKTYWITIKNGINPSQEEEFQFKNDILEWVGRNVIHPHPAKRAERLRARAQQLRVEAAQKELEAGKKF